VGGFLLLSVINGVQSGLNFLRLGFSSVMCTIRLLSSLLAIVGHLIVKSFGSIIVGSEVFMNHVFLQFLYMGCAD